MTSAIIKELLQNATPGKWRTWQGNKDKPFVVCTDREPMELEIEIARITSPHVDADARLIAATPELARIAIEALEKVEELEGRLEDAYYSFMEAEEKASL